MRVDSGKSIFNSPSSDKSLIEYVMGYISHFSPFSSCKLYAIMFIQYVASIGSASLVLYWRSQYFFYRPSSINSIEYAHSINSEFFSPLSYIKRFSVKFKNNIVSFIVSLLFYCRPPTILCTISKHIIFSINAVVNAWSFAHVCKEIFKRISPSITNHDTSTTIINIIGRFLSKASFLYPSPNAIFRSITHVVRHLYFGKLLISKASARNNTAADNVLKNSNVFFATITNTYNSSGSIAAWTNMIGSLTNNSKHSVFCSRIYRGAFLGHFSSLSRYLIGCGKQVINLLFGDQPSHITNYSMVVA